MPTVGFSPPGHTNPAPGFAHAEPLATPSGGTGHKGRWLRAAGIFILVALIVAVVAAVALSRQGSGDYTLTVDECSIDADGTVSVAGTIRADSTESTDIVVSFTDADTSAGLGTTSQRVTATPAGTKWSSDIRVGDTVQRVTCTAMT